jgi:hypothetical protein
MKTLSDLRAACKIHGIKVKKQTLSWGPHLSFEIDGCPASSATVTTKEFLEPRKERFEALQVIREEFAGMTIDGQKVYGLK